MKILEVSWSSEEVVDVPVRPGNYEATQTNPHDGECVLTRASPYRDNLIVITRSGGVLRRWPAHHGNSLW